MALIDSSINTVESYIGNIENGRDKMKESANTFEYVMQNGDFMTFAEGTKFGAEAQAALKKFVNIIDVELSNQITTVAADTRNFLADQRTLNNKSI